VEPQHQENSVLESDTDQLLLVKNASKAGSISAASFGDMKRS
jgi:hypothetical protein